MTKHQGKACPWGPENGAGGDSVWRLGGHSGIPFHRVEDALGKLHAPGSSPCCEHVWGGYMSKPRAGCYGDCGAKGLRALLGAHHLTWESLIQKVPGPAACVSYNGDAQGERDGLTRTWGRPLGWSLKDGRASGWL